jgi:1-acyl-sn-glycerol-3-phosphate acyltransferase
MLRGATLCHNARWRDVAQKREMMKRLPLYCLNMLFLAYMGILALLFGCAVPFFFLLVPLFGRRSDDAGRIMNWCFGRAMITLAWPFVRIERRGTGNVPPGPCVFVANHRSFADVFFCTLLPRPNIDVVVRTWPFRIPLFGSFMRVARYLDIESMPIEQSLGVTRELAGRGVSFVCFPEGHRSRDGRLHPFRSGIFLAAVANDLPVLPVCITGTEQLGGPGSILLRPTRVVVEILPPVWPKDFAGEKRALQMRRHVYAMLQRHLGEAETPHPDGEPN